MTSGMETRAQMDTENFKALLVLNGGGALALLTLLQFVLGNPAYRAMNRPIVLALALLSTGLVCAFVYNRLRRKCSLEYERYGLGSPAELPNPCGRFLRFNLEEPCVCHVSIAFMWVSLAFFVLAVVVVGVAILRIV
jgi:hypothetical protein